MRLPGAAPRSTGIRNSRLTTVAQLYAKAQAMRVRAEYLLEQAHAEATHARIEEMRAHDALKHDDEQRASRAALAAAAHPQHHKRSPRGKGKK